MQVRKVQDTKGVWLINIAKFGFVDPTNGTRFDPQVPTQAAMTEWVKAQEAIIQPWSDPAEEEAQKAALAEAAAAEAAKLAEAAAAEAEALAKKSADKK